MTTADPLHLSGYCPQYSGHNHQLDPALFQAAGGASLRRFPRPPRQAKEGQDPIHQGRSTAASCSRNRSLSARAMVASSLFRQPKSPLRAFSRHSIAGQISRFGRTSFPSGQEVATFLLVRSADNTQEFFLVTDCPATDTGALGDLLYRARAIRCFIWIYSLFFFWPASFSPPPPLSFAF